MLKLIPNIICNSQLHHNLKMTKNDALDSTYKCILTYTLIYIDMIHGTTLFFLLNKTKSS